MSNDERDDAYYAAKAMKYIPVPILDAIDYLCTGCVADGYHELCGALNARSEREGYSSDASYCHRIIWVTNSKKHRVQHIAMRMGITK